MGNVAMFVLLFIPTLEYVKMKVYLLHTEEFRDATLTDLAYKNMKITINALVNTGVQVITDKGLLNRIKEEFNAF